MNDRKWLKFLAAVALAAPAIMHPQEWTSYGGDAGGTRYSALKQIDLSNVNQLQVAWTFHTGDLSDGTELPAHSSFEATPLVVNGLMYITTPFSRVIALEPETGKQVWAFDPKIDKDATVPLYVSRGAAWWTGRHLHFGGIETDTLLARFTGRSELGIRDLRSDDAPFLYQLIRSWELPVHGEISRRL